MANQDVFRIKKTLQDILGDKFSDALVDPKQTLRDIPYEHLSFILQKVPPSSYAFLAEEVNKDNQSLYDVLEVTREFLKIIATRMEGFSKEKLHRKADKYFLDLKLPTSNDAGLRDLSDLKRLVEGNLGVYFHIEKPVEFFLVGDIHERYFDSCLDLFKASRDAEFVELIKNRKAA